MKETQPQLDPEGPLANWTSVSLGNNPNRPTVDEITWGQLRWNMFSDNTTDNRQEWWCNDYDNRPSGETESIGHPIYSDADSSTSGPGLEDVDWIKHVYNQSINLWVVFINYHIYRCV